MTQIQTTQNGILEFSMHYCSFTEKLRFLHKQSLACLRMIEIAEDDTERDRWVSEYTDNQMELMNLQQVNRAIC